jgi:hypothetical protein
MFGGESDFTTSISRTDSLDILCLSIYLASDVVNKTLFIMKSNGTFDSHSKLMISDKPNLLSLVGTIIEEEGIIAAYLGSAQ